MALMPCQCLALTCSRCRCAPLPLLCLSRASWRCCRRGAALAGEWGPPGMASAFEQASGGWSTKASAAHWWHLHPPTVSCMRPPFCRPRWRRPVPRCTIRASRCLAPRRRAAPRWSANGCGHRWSGRRRRWTRLRCRWGQKLGVWAGLRGYPECARHSRSRSQLSWAAACEPCKPCAAGPAASLAAAHAGGEAGGGTR